MSEVTPERGPEHAAMSLEEELFGSSWRDASCTTDEAIDYFTRRFGFASRRSFYDIVGKRLKRVPLDLTNKGRGVVGWILYVSHLVEVCDDIDDRARERLSGRVKD